MANEMRDQLFELLTDCEIEYAQYLSEECDKAIKGDVTKQLFKRLEFYADRLIEEGVIVPPCKIGDTVYEVIAYKNKANNNRIDGHIRPCVAKSIHLSDRYSKKDEPYITLGAGGNYLHGAYIKRVSVDEFGKSVFPNEAQAEQKLKEMRGGNDN